MIRIEREPEDFSGAWMPAEACAFCGRPTRYWHTPADVAVCKPCAETHDESEVPTKAEWLAAVRDTAQPKGGE